MGIRLIPPRLESCAKSFERRAAMGTLHFRRIERRRTARVALRVDLIVQGETENNGMFKAEARTLSVSGHGGMMVLEPEVTIGQKLVLLNANSGQMAECKVVSAKTAGDGKRNVAFEFTSAEINFWKMCFPAPGAKPIRKTAQRRLEPAPATKLA
jgi:hypothetical protein